MKIKNAIFEKSAPDLSHCVDGDKAEIAFLGRSNVGKSSLINLLTNRNKLARTSSAPGRTQTLNFYLINDDFYFVDFPGYGYAKASKSAKRQWHRAREEYLFNREQLRAIVMVVDIRHEASPLDMEMLELLQLLGVPYYIALTKADKISRSRRNQQLMYFAKQFTVSLDMLFVISSEKKFGKDSLLNVLAKHV